MAGGKRLGEPWRGLRDGVGHREADRVEALRARRRGNRLPQRRGIVQGGPSLKVKWSAKALGITFFTKVQELDR